MTQDAASPMFDNLLAKFRRSDPNRRCEILAETEFWECDNVIGFVAGVLRDKKEDECVRIELAGELQWRVTTEIDLEQLAIALTEVVRDRSESEVVRQHYAMALHAFAAIGSVAHLLGLLAMDETEEISLRHNAVASLGRNAANPLCREMLEKLAGLLEFRDTIARRLSSSS